MKNTVGWVCPRCDQVNAPSARKCTCKSTGSSLADRVKTPMPSPRFVTGPPDGDPPGAPPRIIYVGYYAGMRAT